MAFKIPTVSSSVGNPAVTNVPEHFGLEVRLMYPVTDYTFSFALFKLTLDCFSHPKAIVKVEAQTFRQIFFHYRL